MKILKYNGTLDLYSSLFYKLLKTRSCIYKKYIIFLMDNDIFYKLNIIQ